MDLSQIRTELGNYFRVNNKQVNAMVYKQPQMVNYTRPITKVKGEYPHLHSVTGRVVQGFTAAWTPLGNTKFKSNKGIAYHQKVNFPVKPNDVEASWLAELNQLDKLPAERPISQYIIEQELKPAVSRDVDDLFGNGVRDENDLGTYGKSMNGLKFIMNAALQNADNPMYKILLDALTDDNIVAMVEKFERKIPLSIRPFTDNIYMSTINRERYMINYRERFGKNLDYTGPTFKTYLGARNVIGLDCLNGSDLIFTTPASNFNRYIDITVPPTVTDIQVLDYDVKIFMEWFLGVGFSMNQQVVVATFSNLGSGLGADTDLYYAGAVM